MKFGRRAKKSHVREKEENKLVAFHEAGHAVLQALLKDADPLHKVTIIAQAHAGGATVVSLPEKDRMGYSLKWLNATMRVLCGGRIAEEKAMGDVSTAQSMDISQTTNIARMMILVGGIERNWASCTTAARTPARPSSPRRTIPTTPLNLSMRK